MRVGYGKVGRVIEVDPAKWGESGGDNEGPALLLNLARRNPDVTWVVVGRNSGWKPPLPNIENPWQEWGKEVKIPSKSDVTDHIRRLDAVTMPTIAGLDGIVLWLGQHGTSNSPIPKVDDRPVLTSPQISFVHYSSFLLRGVNAWRYADPLAREEVWLIADARNYLKGRDLKWPRRHPILGQYDWKRQEWCERYGDPRRPDECGFDADFVNGKWRAWDHYRGSGLELVGIPEDEHFFQLDWAEREHDFGILINEARNYGMRSEMTRLHAMQTYVKPLDPSWVNGTWTKDSLAKLGMDVSPIEYMNIFSKFKHTKATFTTPSSGSHWATAKPWECFSTGTICFFHPMYDTQGHIIPNLRQLNEHPEDTSELAYLAQWLRVKDPDDLAKKVKAVSTSRETYEWLRDAQLRHLTRELETQRCVTSIERRLGVRQGSSSPVGGGLG